MTANVTDDILPDSAATTPLTDADTGANQLADSETVTKLQTAADIVNRALVAVSNACVDSARIFDVARLGDKFMLDAVQKVYKTAKSDDGSKMHRGIAFPTSINVNNVICHFAPIESDPEAARTLSTGDVVKIEMGVQIDGFPAMVGHTLVVGASAANPVTGKTADVIQSAYIAAEAALRLLRPGKTNFDVTDTVQKIVVDEFKCMPVEGMLSSELKRTVLDGVKQIVLNPSAQQRKEIRPCHFESGEIWTVDVIVTSSAEGKTRPSDTRTTIFKRIPDSSYQLKMQSSRKTFSEITNKCGQMPFTLNQLDDPKKGRVGVLECVKHGLLLPYDVIEDQPKAVVAQFLFTALLMPSGSILKITNYPFEQAAVQSDNQVQDAALKAVLASSTKAPKKSKKKDVVAAAVGES